MTLNPLSLIGGKGGEAPEAPQTPETPTPKIPDNVPKPQTTNVPITANVIFASIDTDSATIDVKSDSADVTFSTNVTIANDVKFTTIDADSATIDVESAFNWCIKFFELS